MAYGAMIDDQVRIDAYAAALRKVIRPDSVVLDIGTGTGIMALLACRFGARRVYAVEPDDAIQTAREIAVANHHADRIVFIQGLSAGVTLPEPADVMVSDIGGLLPWFRHHIPAIIDARRRLLASGGGFIPQRDLGLAAVVDAPDLYRRCDTPWEKNPYDFDLRAGKRLVVNTPAWGEVKPEQWLVAPQTWATLDYAEVTDSAVRATMNWPVTRAGTGHGFIAWFERVLTEGVTLSNAPNAPESHRPKIYGSLFFPWSEPVELEPADSITIALQADLVGEDNIWRWETQVWNRNDPADLKAHFRQSTFLGQPLAPASLQKGEASYVVALNEDGQIDQFLLSLMDGQRSLADIAQQAAAQFPGRFPRWQAALTHVADLARKYSV